MTFLAAGLAGTTLAGSVLASGSGNSSNISYITPGLLGFLVVAALGAALVFLLRSMNKQFRKLGPNPEADGPWVDGTGEDGSAGEAGSVGAAGTTASETTPAGTESPGVNRP